MGSSSHTFWTFSTEAVLCIASNCVLLVHTEMGTTPTQAPERVISLITPPKGNLSADAGEKTVINLITPTSDADVSRQTPGGGESARIPLSERLKAARAIRCRSALWHAALTGEPLTVRQLQSAVSADGVHWDDALIMSFFTSRGITVFR